MSKVVLFSTRAIGENILFGTNCDRKILNSDDSPIFKYFTGNGASDEEKKELGKKFQPTSCFDEIKEYCSQKGVWKDDYGNMNEEEVLGKLNEDEKISGDEGYLDRLRKYYSNDSKAARPFNLDDFKAYLNNVSNNEPIRFALNIDNPNKDVSINERFSLYIKSQNEFVFMAIWPLGRTGKKEENGYNVWISTLVQQISKVVENCEEITLLLHDKDICEPQPFKIIIPQGEYSIDQNKRIKLTVAIFQHSPGDPINAILNNTERDLSKVYNNIVNVLTKKADMTKAGNAHTTRQVYQTRITELENKKQEE